MCFIMPMTDTPGFADLLERSRIVHQSTDERNYHVFYCVFAGMSKGEKGEAQYTLGALSSMT